MGTITIPKGGRPCHHLQNKQSTGVKRTRSKGLGIGQTALSDQELIDLSTEPAEARRQKIAPKTKRKPKHKPQPETIDGAREWDERR